MYKVSFSIKGKIHFLGVLYFNKHNKKESLAEAKKILKGINYKIVFIQKILSVR